MQQKNKKHVCHVIHGIVGGGAEQVILNYCSKIKDEFRFDLIYQYDPNPEILSRFEEQGFYCIQVTDKVHHPLKHIIQLYKIFKKGKYDVVHSHLDWYLNFYVCAIALLAGVKKRISHQHQAYHAIFLRPLFFLLRLFNLIFANIYMACGNDAALSGWGRGLIKKGKVIILPNGVDPERFRFDSKIRDEIRMKYGISNKFCIGHIGRFYPQKNHQFLFNLFVEIHKQNTQSVLLLIGDGPLKKDIQEMARRMNLLPDIIFLDIQKEPEHFYSAMDVFCFPSLWEGVPLALFEAQYNALPCIASQNISKESCISSNFSFLPLNTQEWLLKLSTLSHLNIRQNLIINDNYNINKLAERLKKIYV